MPPPTKKKPGLRRKARSAPRESATDKSLTAETKRAAARSNSGDKTKEQVAPSEETPPEHSKKLRPRQKTKTRTTKKAPTPKSAKQVEAPATKNANVTKKRSMKAAVSSEKEQPQSSTDDTTTTQKRQENSQSTRSKENLVSHSSTYGLYSTMICD